jgi:hypothetical protein
VVTLGLAGGFIYWFVQQRIEDASDAAKVSVLAAHLLVRQAEKQADRELFRSMLSMANTPWADQQESLVARQVRFRRTSIGFFEVRPAGDGEYEVTVALSPDLSTAVVSFPLPYQHLGDLQETFLLQQSDHYVREKDRWLLSPPSPEFWGEWQLFEGRALTASYRQGDAAVAERLAADLDAFVQEICQTLPGIDCPADLRLGLRFDDELAPDLLLAHLASAADQAEDIRLPTPALVGRPVDEVGYQALWQSYATVIARAVIRDATGYRCCEYGQLYNALLSGQLYRLGLRPRPLMEQQYASLAGDAVHLRGLVATLPFESDRAQATAAPAYYALAEFLVDGLDLAAAEVQRAIMSSPAAPPREIFDRLTGYRYGSDNELESAWMRFLQANAAPTSVESPALPEEALQLVCVSMDGESSDLFRYSPASAELAPERALGGVNAYLLALPDELGTVVAEQPGTGTGEIFLSQNGNDVTLLQSEDGIIPVSYPGEAGGESTVLVFNSRIRQYGTISIEECQRGNECDIVPLAGFPLLSPDGSRQLFLVSSGISGYEGRFVRPFVLDSIAGEIISTGKAPFWLDNTTVGFIRPAVEAAIAFDVTESSGRVLFNSADLAAAAPDTRTFDVRMIEIEHLALNPADPDELLVVAVDASRRSHFFTYSRQSGEVAYYDSTDIILGEPVFYDYQFSPDGRWLLISGDDYTQGRAALYFYDVANRESRKFEFPVSYPLPMHWLYDWSNDGQWLSIPDSGYVRLINPEADYQELVMPASGYCTSAAWNAAN